MPSFILKVKDNTGNTKLVHTMGAHAIAAGLQYVEKNGDCRTCDIIAINPEINETQEEAITADTGAEASAT
jgi:hypothetical protein